MKPGDGAALLRVVAGRLLANGSIDASEVPALASALASACADAGVEADQCTPVTLGLFPRDVYEHKLAQKRTVARLAREAFERQGKRS